MAGLTRKEEYSEMFEFCKFMIGLRKKHPILRGRSEAERLWFPGGLHTQQDGMEQQLRVGYAHDRHYVCRAYRGQP